MRSILLLASAALMSGCTTVADLREGPAFIETTTPKSVADFTSCLSNQWAARSGTTSVAPRPNGNAITLSYVIYSNTVAAVTANVDDLGQMRSVTVYARKGDRSDKLRREISACA